jgi:hypothetical protein
VGLGPENDCAGKAVVNYRPCSLVRKGAPHHETCNCLRVIKIWSWAPGGCLTRRQTGQLTVSLQHNFGFDLIRTSIPDAGDSLQDTVTVHS